MENIRLDSFNTRPGNLLYESLSDYESESQSGSSGDDLKYEYRRSFRTWAVLPDILLEKVFSYLNLRDRYHASIVCRHWHNVFYSPYIWRKLVLRENTFTHERYTPYRGYWKELSAHKVQMCLKKVGAFLQTIQIEPMAQFYNLYGFLQIWNLFMEHFTPYPMESLNNFYFTFGCESRQQSEVMVFGTGGKLLDELKRVLKNVRDLEELKLNNLLLDVRDAPGVLDSIMLKCGHTLRFLEIRNYTKELYPMFIAGMFQRLTVLVISPQQLSNDLVAMLAGSALLHLHIIQDHLATEGYQVLKETWLKVHELTPALSVHLSSRGDTPLEIGFQEGAPVCSITYTTKYARTHTEAVDIISIFYSTTLKLYGLYGLPRYYGSRSFDARSDSHLVSLVRTCYKLHTIVIRDRISTASLIILAREGKSLRFIHVRRNALIKKCDWHKMLTWTDESYEKLKVDARDYDLTFAEVSRCLGYRWQPMSDKEFRMLQAPISCTSDSLGDFDTS